MPLRCGGRLLSPVLHFTRSPTAPALEALWASGEESEGVADNEIYRPLPIDDRVLRARVWAQALG